MEAKQGLSILVKNRYVILGFKTSREETGFSTLTFLLLLDAERERDRDRDLDSDVDLEPILDLS